MRYKILKETPNVKAGTVGELEIDRGFYKFGTGLNADCEYYKKSTVESQPNWFEPVIERWKAEAQQKYFYVSESLGVFWYKQNNEFDDEMFELGNYFQTEAKAEEASRRIKKVLMDYHAEILE